MSRYPPDSVDLPPSAFGLSRDELVELLRVRPLRSAARLAVLLAGWVGLGVASLHTGSWPLRVLCWLAAGFFVNGVIQLAHESWHDNLFRRRWQNALFGWCVGLLAGLAHEPLRHDHLAHHRYNRTERDPDAYNAGRSPASVVLYYAVVVFGLPLSILYFNLVYPWQHFPRAALRRHACVLVAMGIFYAALFVVLRRSGLLGAAAHLWLLPVLFASPWNGLKSIADHHANDWRGSRFRGATTARSNAVWTWLWSGLNYHLDHHLFPRVPGYNLPALHRRIRPVLLERGAPIYDGYLAVMVAALRAGPMDIEGKVELTDLRRRPLQRGPGPGR
ncbi:MAG: fatty acid desaturase [Polyangiaceae bacterium]